jgi:spore coat polysaccharide biosynthesis predicted glycosyltransferase SpsG
MVFLNFLVIYLTEHPNVGQSSTIEAVYTGTPMVGLPLFSDQYSNIRSLVLKGTAVLLDIRKLSKEDVSKALQKVLNDVRWGFNFQMNLLSQVSFTSFLICVFNILIFFW